MTDTQELLDFEESIRQTLPPRFLNTPVEELPPGLKQRFDAVVAIKQAQEANQPS